MLRASAGLIGVALFTAAVSSQAPPRTEPPSRVQLVGEWNFEAFAEVDAPEKRTPVGTIMEFREDGTVVTRTTTGDRKATYVLKGNTIIYSDPKGDQVWTVRSFEPGKSLVVEHRRSLMFLMKRRQAE